MFSQGRGRAGHSNSPALLPNYVTTGVFQRERERDTTDRQTTPRNGSALLVINQPIIYHSWPLLKCNSVETYCHHCSGGGIILLNKSLELRLKRGQKMKNNLINSGDFQNRTKCVKIFLGNIWFRDNSKIF